MKLSIIIPAYNEEHTVKAIVHLVQAVDLGPIEREIVVVDDGSEDGTAAVLKSLPGIRHVSHERNAGKGAAVATGIKAATGDILLIQDADLEYDPEDIPAVIKPIVERLADVVLGSRFLWERPVFWGRRRSPYLSHYMGNMTIVFVTNLLYGRRFTDYEGCYKAFTRSALASVTVGARGFEYDNELVCKLMRKGARIAEVPIWYAPRTYASGKKITWRHGLVILWTILKWRFLPV
jgi:glycosyltransferase involved in cell wall biosynthesis